MRQALIGAMVLVLLVGLTGCPLKPKKAAPEKETKSEQKAIAVSLALITPRDLEERVEVTGTLKPADEVKISSRVEGAIEWIVGKAGATVRAGELVATMDDADAKAQVGAAQAGVQAAQARLEQAKAAAAQQKTSTVTGVQSAEAAVEAAEARLKQARTMVIAQEAIAGAQQRTADAALDSAKSRLALLRSGARSQELAISEKSVQVAQATYDNDERNSQRLQKLFDEGAISRSQLDLADTRLQVSKAQLESAKQQYSLVKTGARDEDIQAAEAAVRQAEGGVAQARAGQKQIDVARDNANIAETALKQAKAALEAARSARQIDIMRDKDVLAAKAGLEQSREMLRIALQGLDHTRLYSPVNGVIAERYVEIGESVGLRIPLLRIATNAALYFETKISELEAVRVQSGQPVYLTVDAMQNSRSDMYRQQTTRQVVGTVEKVVPVVDQMTRNFTVRILVPRSGNLFPGMFARGQIVVAKHKLVTAIPKDALVEKGGRHVVFVSENNTARKRDVTPGATDGAYIQILSGVSPGEKVVVAGQQNLADGDPLQERQTPKTPAVGMPQTGQPGNAADGD
ncbi:MAG: efflux RND transporter periplasmic adaptor subunit [Armatimonadota bacterium]